MKLFNFRGKEAPSTMQEPQTSVNEPETNVPEVPKSEKDTLVVSYATGWPIDVIYGYFHKNFEEKGFKDAMINSDGAFCEMNMDLIKNKILMIFREIKLNYNVKRQELETQISNCQAAGLITTVADIQVRVSLIDSHEEELRRLEDEFNTNPQASIPLKSYRCGFMRGVGTLAISAAEGTMPQCKGLA